MMSRWLKNLILAMVLAALPLQGIAATLSVLTCHGDTQVYAAHADAGQNQDVHHEHGGQLDDSTDNHPGGFHLCCNLTVSVPPLLTVQAPLPDFPVRALAPAVLHDLFFPDQPQRPPLA